MAASKKTTRVRGSVKKNDQAVRSGELSQPLDVVAVENTKSGKFVVVNDESDSECSVVSVSRKVAFSIEEGPAVKMFGTVESDDELRVDVRNTRPKFTPSKAGALVKDGESRRRGVDVKGKAPVIAGESSELDSKGGLLPSEESFVFLDRKRRSEEKDSGFPAKVRVKDLSAPAVAGDRNSAGTELKAVRSRRLSSKARHAREGISLLDKFTDESYHGESRRAVRKSGRSKPSRSLDVTGQNDVPGDSRVGAAANQTDGFKLNTVLRSLTDTEDELPSPSTIFSATATRASSGTLSSRGNGSPCQVTDNSDKCGDVRGEISLGRLPGTDNVSNRRSDDVDGVSGVVTKESSLPISLGDSAEPVKQPSRVFSDAIPFVDDEASVSEDDGSDCKESSVSPLLDADCIHPDLKSLYVTMDWINSLRRSCFIGYPNTESMFDDFSAISFGVLIDKLNSRVRSKLLRSMVFVEYRDFKNPVRLSLTNFVRSWECIRVPHAEGNRNAVFVLTGVSTQSFVGQGREIGQTFVKQLYVRPLENDWEILQSNIGSFFNDSRLHAPGRRCALVFQTKRQGWIKQSERDKDSDSLAAAPYSSISKSVSMRSQKVAESFEPVAAVNVLDRGAPAYRTFEDGIPLYDGRTKPGTKGFQFGSRDWEAYTKLPSYPFPEVEDNSLVTVAFTLTGFRGNNSTHHTVHFNGLFAIILGKVDD